MFVLGILTINLSIVGTRTNGSLSLNTLKLMQASAEELDPVEITCNANPPGQCWIEDCHWVPTPLGGWFMTYCPEFTGRMDDHCENNMPC